MLRSYFITALRKLARNKSYTLINVLGLSLGITGALMIFLIVRFELSFDDFHVKRDRIYRVNTDAQSPEGTLYDIGTQYPLAPALRSDFSELEKVTVCDYVTNGLIMIAGKDGSPRKFQENTGLAYVEPEFFDIFDFEWRAGNPRSSLSEPNTMVLTEEMCQKYFPGEDPVGKTVRLDNEKDLKITGILKDFPDNTDFPFKALISYATMVSTGKSPFGSSLKNWDNTSSNVNTYLLAPNNFDPRQLEDRLPNFLKKYFKNDDVSRLRIYHLQPLTTVHYDTRYGNYPGRTTGTESLWALAIIGVFLIITACINFINMATAQAMQRSREIGVRKVLGAYRVQLIGQFMGETFLITAFAVLVSMGLTELLFPKLTAILELHVRLHFFSDAPVVLFLSLLALGVSFLAGIYPALILSGFKPVLALKGKITPSHGGGMTLRKGLVVLQFAITQTLIIGTLVVASQIQLFHTKDLGYDKEAVVTVPLPTSEKAKLESLRAQLTNQSDIRDFTFAYASASSANNWTSNFRFNDGTVIQNYTANLKMADEHYISTYGLKLLAGRNIAASDTTREFIANEALIMKLGFHSPQEAVGKTINFWKHQDFPIVGVVKDFHMHSLHDEIELCLIGARRGVYQEASFKISLDQTHETLAKIEKAWSNVYPEFVFEYHFLDETINDFYKQEEKISKLFRIFSGIAIFIGSIGLFGLISFMAAQRTKEIGVRKVLGATIGDILLMFSREFALLILVAFAAAAPLAYYVMDRWLQDFAYRISIGAGVFCASVLFTIIVAAVTVGYRAVKAATGNPVEALKYE